MDTVTARNGGQRIDMPGLIRRPAFSFAASRESDRTRPSDRPAADRSWLTGSPRSASLSTRVDAIP